MLQRWPGLGGLGMLGLTASGGLDVFSDAVGVDQPGGYPGGGGYCGGGDRRAGGFEGVDGVQGAPAFELAVLCAGRAEGAGAGFVARLGGHTIPGMR